MWYTSYGKNKKHLCYAFTMEPRRHLADMWNRNFIFFVTSYTTKGAQNEELFPFLKCCTAIVMRIRKLRENQNKLKQEIGNEVENSDISMEQIFLLGWVMFYLELWCIYLQQ
jgi:hypothetical protein